MRIAVTGAAGYIGGWLCAELTERGHEVHAQDVRDPGTAVSGSWSFFDLSDQDARRRWLERPAPDVVVHLAALYGRVWGELDLTATVTANTAMTAELARDCESRGIRLLFSSSSEVYGESANSAVMNPETSLLRPLNMYGLSKKWGEEACRLYAPQGLMICRLNMPYGPAKTPPPRGTAPATSGKAGQIGYNVLHTMCWQAAHGMDLTVHTGTRRCLTWVGDTVRGLAMIAESGRAGTWNVNRNDDHVPVASLAQRIVALAGSTSQIVQVSPPPRVTLRKSLSNGELLDLGWTPRVPLDEGMKRSLEYYAKFDKNGDWQG